MALWNPLLQNTELQFLSLKVGWDPEWLDPESSVSRIVVHESEGATSGDDTIELASILVGKSRSDTLCWWRWNNKRLGTDFREK